MELTFVNQYAGQPFKRRRLARACESCRTRKKRCAHLLPMDFDFGQNDHTPFATSSHSTTDGNRNRNDENPTSIHTDGSQPVSEQATHFISDLSPASGLMKRSADTDDPDSPSSTPRVGIWVDRRKWEVLLKQKEDASSSSHQLRNDTRPHSAVLAPLIDIYFVKVHPILPLLDEREFRRTHAGGMMPEPLVHAVCLVAAKDASAVPHLRVTGAATPVSPRRFCSVLHASVLGALKTSVQFEKITLIRILALTSLHNEGSDGAEEASIHLSQAIHYAQTLGIHLGQHTGLPASNQLTVKRLFWCLYSLDRVNSAINGRPIIMSDIDMSIEHFKPGESGFPAFEAWLRIVWLLNQIIAFYRPTNDNNPTGWEDSYPGLEEILDNARAWHLSPSSLATLHLFYLDVAMLSHRTRSVKQIPRGLSSQVRQRLAALEVTRLMSNGAYAGDIHPLPIVPHAVSMALSVAYQHLRQSQFDHQQVDALADFRTCCTILQRLRGTWASADSMAALGKNVQEELDRAPCLASFRVRRPRREANGNDDYGTDSSCTHLVPPPAACRYEVGGVDVLGSSESVLGQSRVGATAINNYSQAADLIHVPTEGGTAGLSLFDNVDDVFGTFMDPNYPLSLEDMAMVEDLPWPASYAS